MVCRDPLANWSWLDEFVLMRRQLTAVGAIAASLSFSVVRLSSLIKTEAVKTMVQRAGAHQPLAGHEKDWARD